MWALKIVGFLSVLAILWGIFWVLSKKKAPEDAANKQTELPRGNQPALKQSDAGEE